MGIRLLGHLLTGALAFTKRIYDDSLDASRGSAQIAAHGIEGSNRTVRIASIPGVRGEDEATADYHAKRSELEGLKDKRGTFTGIEGGYWDQFKHGLKSRFGVQTWFGQSPIETSGERGERENEEKITQAEQKTRAARKLAQTKFRDGVGRMELDAQKARIAGHMEEARGIEYKILAEKTYNSLLEKSGSEKFAKEGADLAVVERKREVAGDFRRNLDSHAGRGDIARVATLAIGYMNGELSGHIKTQNEILKEQGAKADAAWRAKFTRRSV